MFLINREPYPENAAIPIPGEVFRYWAREIVVLVLEILYLGSLVLLFALWMKSR